MAITYLGRQLSFSTKETKAIATVAPMSKLVASSDPVMSLRLVIARTSCPRAISRSASTKDWARLSSALEGESRSFSTSRVMVASFEARPEIKHSNCVVVFGTYDPAMIKPPTEVERESADAEIGGIGEIASRAETKAAPVRKRKLLPRLAAGSKGISLCQLAHGVCTNLQEYPEPQCRHPPQQPH